MNFSEKLYLLRKKGGLSQEQLAEMLDVSRQSVSKWESQQTLPETSKIIKIADIFNVPVDTLLNDNQKIENNNQLDLINKEGETKFCPQCGTAINDTDLFCGNCGLKTNISNNSKQSNISSASQISTARVKPKIKQRKKSVKIVIFSILGLLLIGTGILLYILFGTKSVDKSNNIKNYGDKSSSIKNYDEKINEYKSALTIGLDKFEKAYPDSSLINRDMIQMIYNYGGDIYYGMYDIDDNGTLELAFSVSPETDNHNIIDVYTLDDDDKAVKLFSDASFGDRTKLYILSDGSLLTEGANSAFSSQGELYYIDVDTNKLKLKNGWIYSSEDSSDYISFLNGKYDDYIKLGVNEYVDKMQEIKNTSINNKIIWTNIISPEDSNESSSVKQTSKTTSSQSKKTKSQSSVKQTTNVTPSSQSKNSKHKHTFYASNGNPEKKTHTLICSECKAKKNENHNFTEWCNEGKTHYRFCTICKCSVSTSHNYKSTVTKKPTTKTTGTLTHTCKDCGNKKYEKIPKLTSSETTDTNPKTQTYNYKKTCSYCDHNDGSVKLTLYNGVEQEIQWKCSSCKKENTHYFTYNW